MAQFSLYKNQDKNTSKAYPYFVDVQNELVASLDSRLVIPLTPIALMENKAPKQLCPIICLQDGDFILLTHQLTSVPAKYLKEAVADLTSFRDEIIGAIDFLITGI